MKVTVNDGMPQRILRLLFKRLLLSQADYGLQDEATNAEIQTMFKENCRQAEILIITNVSHQVMV